MGLRELKKQKTRKAISNLATRLFIERGYHEVTTAEIAAQAEVSVPTLYNYFPTKEALVFDEDHEIENMLVNWVLKRKKGQSIHAALLEGGLAEIDAIQGDVTLQFRKFNALITGTPELNLYAQQMWLRHEESLAAAIRKETKNNLGKIEAGALARFVLDSFHRSLGAANPKAALRALFKLLETGWSD